VGQWRFYTKGVNINFIEIQDNIKISTNLIGTIALKDNKVIFVLTDKSTVAREFNFVEEARSYFNSIT
jgi:hypothetical protein